jgi:translation initiation factor IF-1
MSNIVKVGAKVSKTAKRAERKNTSNLRVAVEDDSALFGRVTKLLGNRRFLVTYWDPKDRRHVPDIQVSIAKKKVRIDINDIVNIAGSGRDWEIQAQIDAKAANKLKKEGRISAELLLSAESALDKAARGGDGLEFIYEEDEEKEETEAEEAAKPKAPVRVKKLVEVEGDLEDGDIDDI